MIGTDQPKAPEPDRLARLEQASKGYSLESFKAWQAIKTLAAHAVVAFAVAAYLRENSVYSRWWTWVAGYGAFATLVVILNVFEYYKSETQYANNERFLGRDAYWSDQKGNRYYRTGMLRQAVRALLLLVGALVVAGAAYIALDPEASIFPSLFGAYQAASWFSATRVLYLIKRDEAYRYFDAQEAAVHNRPNDDIARQQPTGYSDIEGTI